MPRRRVCGNDPTAKLTPGDQAVVDEFKAYLATKARARAGLPGLLAAASSTQWRVYVYDAEQWMPVGMACPTRDGAAAKERSFLERHDYAITQIVRETTSYEKD